jgi:hypothetical protein
METKKRQTVSLKEAILTGLVLDVIFLVFSSTIMDGGFIFLIVAILVIAQWIGNASILLSQKARQSNVGKDFIRFGILPLVCITFLVRGVLATIGVGF